MEMWPQMRDDLSLGGQFSSFLPSVHLIYVLIKEVVFGGSALISERGTFVIYLYCSNYLNKMFRNCSINQTSQICFGIILTQVSFKKHDRFLLCQDVKNKIINVILTCQGNACVLRPCMCVKAICVLRPYVC